MLSSRAAQQAQGEGAERVLAMRKLGNGHQYEIQWRGQQETTWEAATRVRREVPQLVQEFERRQPQPQPHPQPQQQPAEGSTDSDEAAMPQEAAAAQPGSGAAVDTAALQRQVAELALLVKQQAQTAEEQQRHARQQQSLIEQLRASPAHSPQPSAHPPPQLSPLQEPHLTAVAAAAVGPAAESVSRFARKEPRAQDLREYDGATGAKLDAWLDELGAAIDLFRLNGLEAVDFGVSRLRGAARQWWNTLGVGKTAIGNAAALTTAIKARFQPITTERTAREQLRALRQGARNVNDYIADFQRLRALLPDMSEADALFAFESGLGANLAEKLRMQGVSSVHEAIAMAARVGGLTQTAGSGAAQQGRSSLHQMDIDDGDGAAAALDERIQKAVLNAMHARDSSSGMGAKTQTHRGYTQEHGPSIGAGRGGRGGRDGRGGRFGPRGPPPVPGVPEQVVQRRWDAKQCLRCGQGGHNSHACPNAISASGN
jgi:hypothetical protein